MYYCIYIHRYTITICERVAPAIGSKYYFNIIQLNYTKNKNKMPDIIKLGE